MQLAREKLHREINIIEIVKAWRYFSKALHYLLPEKERLDFKERTRYISINPDPDKAAVLVKSTNVLRIKKALSMRRENFSDGFFSSDGGNSARPNIDL